MLRSGSFLVDQEFHLFHAIDRELYVVLVGALGREPVEAMHVMALWLWLERADAVNLVVHRILSLPLAFIRFLAEEAAAVLAVLSGRHDPAALGSEDVYLTQSIIVKRSDILSPQFLSLPQAAASVDKILNEICARAFADIMQNMAQIQANQARNPPPSPKNPPSSPSHQSSSQPRFAGGGCEDVPDDRTLFVTFSRGYPVSEEEIKEFFDKSYGNICKIQTLFMSNELYAVIVLSSESAVQWILRDAYKVKFSINGKHVWARRFVPKNKQAFQLPQTPNTAVAAAAASLQHFPVAF